MPVRGRSRLPIDLVPMESKQSSQFMEVAIAKDSVILRLVVGVLFLLGGIALWYSKQAPILGILAASFAAAMLVFGFRLLLDFRPGLVIQATGLTLNGKLGYGGVVLWSDIIGFSLTRYGHDHQLIVNVRQPETYIARGSYIYRKLNSISDALFGSPIRINAGLLDYNRNDLLRVLNDFHMR
jgi:protein-S-isoprenylcysteine O-methyltransferase Ste14